MHLSLGRVGVNCIFSVTSLKIGFGKRTANPTFTDKMLRAPIVDASLFVHGLKLGRNLLNSTGVRKR